MATPTSTWHAYIYGAMEIAKAVLEDADVSLSAGTDASKLA